MTTRPLYLGGTRPLDGSGETARLDVEAGDLVTHGVVTGMTGSGKTGLLMVLVEEALQSRVPVVMIDIKGSLIGIWARRTSRGCAPRSRRGC